VAQFEHFFLASQLARTAANYCVLLMLVKCRFGIAANDQEVIVCQQQLDSSLDNIAYT